MRVISGKWKGRKLFAPPGSTTRPTVDRVKESIFNVLMGKVANAVVLDPFAGSGSLGIEALSRGAGKVVMFEHDKQAIQAIKKNLGKDLDDQRLTFMELDYKIGLKKVDDIFDLVFLDPPYCRGEIANILEILHSRHLLAKKATIVIETDTKKPEKISDDLLPLYSFRKESKFGNTTVLYYYYNIEN